MKFTREQATKSQRGSILPLTSAPDGGGWSTPCPGCLIPGERHGTRCIGGWVDPRPGLDGCEKSRLHLGSIPGPSSP